MNLFSSLSCLFFISQTLCSPTKTKEATGSLLDFFITNIGSFYLLSVSVFVVFLLAIAFSGFGRIKLGKKDEAPSTA